MKRAPWLDAEQKAIGRDQTATWHEGRSSFKILLHWWQVAFEGLKFYSYYHWNYNTLNFSCWNCFKSSMISLLENNVVSTRRKEVSNWRLFSQIGELADGLTIGQGNHINQVESEMNTTVENIPCNVKNHLISVNGSEIDGQTLVAPM